MQRKRFLIFATLFLFACDSPQTATDEHENKSSPKTLNREQIKDAVSSSDVLGVSAWKLSENREAWIAELDVPGILMSVGNDNAGVIGAISDLRSGANVMLRCLEFSAIVMKPQTENERARVAEAVEMAAINGEEQNYELNGIALSVTPTPVGEDIIFSCIAKVASK